MNSVFLATVLGWYFLILGILLLARHDYAQSAMKDVVSQRGSFFILALITLIIGLLIVASHNLWVSGWAVSITIIGWILLISGLLRVFFAEHAINMMKSFLKHTSSMMIAGVIFIILGVYLLYHVCY